MLQPIKSKCSMNKTFSILKAGMRNMNEALFKRILNICIVLQLIYTDNTSQKQTF